MQFIRFLIIFILLAGALYYLYDSNDFTNNDTHDVQEQQQTVREPEKRDLKQPSNMLEGDIYGWMNEASSDLREAYGDPVRKDRSQYGYMWWIYNDLDGEYVQFGIHDDSVKTIYIAGMNASSEPLSTNKKYADIQDIFSFDEEVMFEKDDYHYTFHLSQADLKARPLIKINDDLFIQVYMDTFRERLLAVRIVTADILLSLLPYSLTFE
ncbi:MAG TPA: CAP-associated domain-containing protein [Bacillota bacterium]|nr:CAP-associated domain-containing protein [Bacillota bacterium]